MNDMNDNLRVFVYGHYDSRGGTVAISAIDRDAADDIYNEELFDQSGMISYLKKAQEEGEFVHPDTWVGPAKDDFLYVAILENAPDFGQETYDLEGEKAGGEVWFAGDIEEAQDQLVEQDEDIHLIWIARITALLKAAQSGWSHPDWSDGAYSFILLRRDK